jgi:tetratricopeptide (TPR) repeat protein
MTLEPPRRTFKDPRPGKSGLRDVDSVARAEKFKILAWALFAGLPMGGLVGYVLGHVLIGAVLGPTIIWLVAMGIMRGPARAGSLLFMPSGISTPREEGHSRAEALAARGDFQGAIAVYQAAIQDAPENGEPYRRIARIYRDHLDSPEEALRWFRRAIEDGSLPHGKEMLVRREMAELLIHRLKEPRRAAPDLARLAESRKGTPEGEWARKELEAIKKDMTQDEDGPS